MKCDVVIRPVGYLRMSPRPTDGNSLQVQRRKIEAYAEALDLSIVEVIEDAQLSGKTLRRPGIQRVLAMLDRGEANGVIVAKLDRLTRSVKDLAFLIENYFDDRFALFSVGDSIDTRNANGRLVVHMLGSIAQWERESTAERTREALAELRRQGVRMGGVPLGERWSERTDANKRRIVEADAAELQIVAYVGALSAEGFSIRAIAELLDAEGLRPRKGSRWHHTQIQRILARLRASRAA